MPVASRVAFPAESKAEVSGSYTMSIVAIQEMIARCEVTESECESATPGPNWPSM
jgi:hypothetical protein